LRDPLLNGVQVGPVSYPLVLEYRAKLTGDEVNEVRLCVGRTRLRRPVPQVRGVEVGAQSAEHTVHVLA
jgi:hypothetical protein